MQDEDRWYRLDTAAKVYPAIISAKQVNIFRIGCTLIDFIDPEILQMALLITLKRYPSFDVRMKRGAFWFYFEDNTSDPVALQETGFPCQGIDPQRAGNFLFRVIWFRKRITLEVFHVLADGTAGLEFLKTLVYYYLSLSGKPVDPGPFVLTHATKPDSEETENAFQRYYDPKITTGRAEEKAFHFSGTLLPLDELRVIQGVIPVEQVLAKSHALNCTLTEYLTAVLLKAYFNATPDPQNSNEMVKISVPVNLRRFFPSRTLRNFSFYANIGDRFSNRDRPFPELVDLIRTQMRTEMQPEKILPRMNPNVQVEKNPIVRITPLEIKQPVIRHAHKVVGDDLFTCSMSNLGPIKLPESMAQYIDQFDFILSCSDRVSTNCSFCSFNQKLIISFSSLIAERAIEREFFRFLAEEGMDILIQSTEN